MFGFGGAWKLLIILVISLLLLSVVGAIIFIVAKVGADNARLAPSNDERIRCLECAEWKMLEAVKCRFCGARIDHSETP